MTKRLFRYLAKPCQKRKGRLQPTQPSYKELGNQETRNKKARKCDTKTTTTRKIGDTGRNMGRAIDPSPHLFTSAFTQPFLPAHDMSAPFLEALNYDKKSQSMQLYTGKITVLTIHFDSPVKHHLKPRAISGRETKSTS